MTKQFEVLSKNVLLKGVLHYNKKKNSPLVILLTGDSPKGTTSKTWEPVSSSLIRNDFNVVLFDFHSQGKSNGNRNKLSLNIGIQNLKDVWSFLPKIIGLKQRKVGIVGSSFGGSVILNSTSILRSIDALVLKSPAITLSSTWEKEHDSLKGLEQWENNKISENTGISFSAYLDSLKYNGFQKAKQIKCPVKIIHGTEDELVPTYDSKKLSLLIGQNCSIELLKGVKHNYKQEGALDKFITITNNFFIKELLNK